MVTGNPGETFAPRAGKEADGAALVAGRYRLIRRLGAGGMASVDLAEDVRLGREVAVKRLHSGRAEEDAQRFAREARLGATLNHPNLVTVFDALSDGDTVVIVMEYVGGTDLGAMLGSEPLGEEETLRILDSLARAIDHAHEHGIVHRDVKPSNVLIGDDGAVKLADLGIARALEDTAITGSGVVLGSLPYIAPEALRGEEIGPEADVYSLALIAYEALTGTRARREGTVPDVTHQAVNEPPPDLRKQRADLHAAAADVVARALDPDPSKRPSSAPAFVSELREALAQTAPAPAPTVPMTPEPPAPSEDADESEAVEPPPPPPRSFEPPAHPAGPEGRRRWALPLIGAVLAIGAIVVFAVLVLGGGSGGSGPSKQASGGGKGAAASSEGGAAASAASRTTPDGAVKAFYEQAAAGDYRGAWKVADSNFRSQLGGFSAFESQQSTLESIEFPSIDVTSESGSSATVSFSTVATHTSFVDRCDGSMSLIAANGGWVIDEAQDISCDRSSA